MNPDTKHPARQSVLETESLNTINTLPSSPYSDTRPPSVPTRESSSDNGNPEDESIRGIIRTHLSQQPGGIRHLWYLVVV